MSKLSRRILKMKMKCKENFHITKKPVSLDRMCVRVTSHHYLLFVVGYRWEMGKLELDKKILCPILIHTHTLSLILICSSVLLST